MDLDSVGGEWNPGEQIKIKLFDGDNDINSLDKDFMGIYNPSIPLPTIVTGNPITLDDVVSLSSGTIISLGEHTKRALIVGAVPNEPIIATYMITFDYYEPDLFYFSHTRSATRLPPELAVPSVILTVWLPSGMPSNILIVADLVCEK